MHVGQWSLSVQSAVVPPERGGGSHYPVLEYVLSNASRRLAGDAKADDSMPVIKDLAHAWQHCCETTRSAVRLGLVSRNQRVENLNTWLVCSEGDVANLARMPQHAQREISASVVALGVHSFEASLRADTHWDSAKRLVNWLAHQGALSGRWTQVVPWDRVGYLWRTRRMWCRFADAAASDGGHKALCPQHALNNANYARATQECLSAWASLKLATCYRLAPGTRRQRA